MDPIDSHATTIVAADGYRLAAREYSAAGVPVGAVLIVSAMAVPQSFYADLARWLARQGWQVVTFDYRGTGDSAPPTLHGLKPTFSPGRVKTVLPPSPSRAASPPADR